MKAYLTTIGKDTEIKQPKLQASASKKTQQKTQASESSQASQWLRDLSKKQRNEMNMGQLFAVAVFSPRDSDGFMLENLVRTMIIEECSQIKLKLDLTSSTASDLANRVEQMEAK